MTALWRHEERRGVAEMTRGASLDWQLAPRAGFARYGVQLFVKAWQYIPAGQVIFAGPQAQVAFACCSVWHCASEAFGGALCPFASAKPADMAVASNAMAKVLSMVFSSLDFRRKNFIRANMSYRWGKSARPAGFVPATGFAEAERASARGRIGGDQTPEQIKRAMSDNR